MARRVFYSFHYKNDVMRAAMVRSIGVIEGNAPVSSNDWEEVKRGGDAAIERWIANQMQGRTCTVVLVGADTAGRPWINHEIVELWNCGMGVVGIRVHGLIDARETKTAPYYGTSAFGANPFDQVTHEPTSRQLSSIVKCYDPGGADSKQRYAWIEHYLSDAIEEAIKIRGAHQ